MKIDHIECQVVCDGEVLTEYQEKLDGEREKSCHIVSETGKVRSIMFNIANCISTVVIDLFCTITQSPTRVQRVGASMG